MSKVAVLYFMLSVIYCATSTQDFEQIKLLARKWAPLIWMSPEERYYPSDVHTFLQNVHLDNGHGKTIMLTINGTHFPNINTKSLYLVTNHKLDKLENSESFLNGHNPSLYSVPIYALISPCTPNNSFRVSSSSAFQNDLKLQQKSPGLFFSVSYWAFYPFNKGKELCFIGKVPSLTIFGRCLGRLKTIGSHVGDWEHMSLSFAGNPYPSDMYLSIHNSGGYYKYEPQKRLFKLNTSASKRVQNQTLPPIVRLQEGHPVLFAAQGSHGLWPAPGEHDYLKIPRLTDRCGYGTPWKTWQNMELFNLGKMDLPKWMFFKGRWGNPKGNCILWKKLGLCEYGDGPPGIVRNKMELSC